MKTFNEFINDKSFQLYFDLDGVLVDLQKGISEKTGLNLNSDDKMLMMRALVRLRREGINIKEFFTDLDWTTDGQKLWNFALPYNPYILSAGSGDGEVKAGKLAWCAKNLKIPESRIIIDVNKQLYANSKSVLIDDYIGNVEKWRLAGGIAILLNYFNKSKFPFITALRLPVFLLVR